MSGSLKVSKITNKCSLRFSNIEPGTFFRFTGLGIKLYIKVDAESAYPVGSRGSLLEKVSNSFYVYPVHVNIQWEDAHD